MQLAGLVILPRLPSGSGVGVEVGKPMGAGPVWREQACWPHSRQVQAWASGVKRGDCCSEIPGASWRPSSNFKALGSLWGQVQDLCCTAEVIRPALALVLAELLAKAVKTPSSLVSPPTSPLLTQRPHYKRGNFLCQSPRSLKAPTLSMLPWRTCDGGSSLSPGQL